jgi:hypothetical protein
MATSDPGVRHTLATGYLETVGLREVIATILLAALVFFSPPLFFIERYSLTAINKPLILGLILFLAVLFLNRFELSRPAVQLGSLQLAQASTLLVLAFLHLSFGYGLDIGYFSVAFQILAGLALFQVLANTDRIRFFAAFWVNLHLLIGALGFLIFAGGIAFNIQPLGTFLDRPYYDFGLTYTNIFYQVGDVKLIRVAGFYDEPGTFAFYMTFSLLMARIFGMARWKEVLLIIFGLTSISMAFIVVTFLWLLFSLNKQTLKYVLLIVALVAVALGRLDPDIRDRAYHVTVDRFSIAKSGGRLLKGDSRTPIMKDNFRAFVDAPIIGHGLHYEEYVGNQYRSSFIVNPMAPFATHGVLGASLVNLHVIVLVIVLLGSKRLRGREKVLLFLVLIATLAQRPITINGFGYILFIVMIYELMRQRLPESYPRQA